MAAEVSVIEQECWGKTHYRVMRPDGQRVFGTCSMLDFPTEDEAIVSVKADFSRNRLGPVRISVFRIDGFPKQKLVSVICSNE